MSLGFKRVMSSIMAFVMMVSTLVMVNVASVSAATYTYEYINGTTNTDNYFTEGSGADSQANEKVVYPVSITDASGSSKSITQGLKLNNSGTLSFTVHGNANVTVIYSTRKDKTDTTTGLSFDEGKTQVDSATNDNGAKTYTGTLQAGNYTIKKANNTSEGVLYYVKVEDTVEGTLTSYSITGTSNLSEGDTFSVGDYTANVGAGGNWTVNETVAEAPFAAGNEFGVSKAGYTVSPETITLEQGADATSFTGGNLSFTQIDLTVLDEGTYDETAIEKGLPNFSITNAGYPNDLNRITTGGNDNVKFMVNDNATVTVTYRCVSGDKKCAAVISSEGGEVKATGEETDNKTSMTVTASGLSAGTYVITTTTTNEQNTSAYIESIAVSYEESQEPTPVNVTVGGVVSNAEEALQGAQVKAEIGSNSQSMTSEAGGTFNFTFNNITPDASGSVVVTLTTTMEGYKTDETIVTLGTADSYTKSDVAITLEAETTEPSGEIIYPDGAVKAGSYKGTKSIGVSKENGFITSGIASGSAEIKFSTDNGYFSFVMATAGTIQFGPITGNVALYDANGNRTEIGTDVINLNAGQYYVMGAASAKIAKISSMEANIIITYTGTVVNSYTITGTVKNTNGEAIANATVTAGTYDTTTNANGEYTITVSDGAPISEVSVTAEGYVSDSYTPDDAYTSDATVDFTLYRESAEVTVTGKVTDKSNAPVAGAEVTVTMNSTIIASTSRTVVTDSDGVYSAVFTVAAEEASTVTASVSVSALGYDTATATTSAPTEATITQNITMSLTQSTPSTGNESVWTPNSESDLLGAAFNELKTGTRTESGDNVPSAFVELIFNDGTTGSIAGQTYTEIDSKGTTFVPKYTGKIKLYIVAANNSGVKTIEISDGNTKVFNGTIPNRRDNTAMNPIEFDVTAGTTYTISNSSAYLYRAVLTTSEGSTVDPFDLSVKVMDGNTPVEGATITINGVIQKTSYADGVYTISGLTSAVTSVAASAAEYASGSVTGLNITTANSDDPVEIALEKRTDVTVQFTVTGDAANSAITIKNVTKNETQTLTSGTKTFTADIGDKFTFESKASNIYMWEPKENINYYNYDSTRYFVYNLPDDAVAGETYTVTFTGKNGIGNTIAYTNDKLQALKYGQYGFGVDKATLNGNDATLFTNFAFITPTLKDYAMGFSDDDYNGIDQTSEIKTANQYGIISMNSTELSYVEFQLAADLGVDSVNVTIDLSGNIKLTDVTDGGEKQVGTAGSKTTFTLIPGHTYRIEDTKGTSYIKSIRLFDPNNVFNNAAATNKRVENLGDASSLLTRDHELASALNLSGSEGQVFRIIGQIALAEADKTNPDGALSAIDQVGFDVYDKDAYDIANEDVTGNFHYNDGLSSMLQSGSETAPDYDEIIWEDIVNSAIDTDNDGTPDIGHLGSEATGDDLYVQTFFATETNKVLIPWVRYSGSSTKVYSECLKTGENVAITLEVQ